MSASSTEQGFRIFFMLKFILNYLLGSNLPSPLASWLDVLVVLRLHAIEEQFFCCLFFYLFSYQLMLVICMLQIAFEEICLLKFHKILIILSVVSFFTGSWFFVLLPVYSIYEAKYWSQMFGFHFGQSICHRSPIIATLKDAF